MLFSEYAHTGDLGMIDPKASVLELTIDNCDFTLKQSPGTLNSTRAGGTTGAAVWRIAPVLARWLSSSNNQLFQLGILGSEACVLELGAGVAALVPLMLAPKISRYIATDQQYSLKVLEENVASNNQITSKPKSRVKGRVGKETSLPIDIVPLDWESDDVQSLLNSIGLKSGVDLVFASDCIYNYALIKPLVQACVDACGMRVGKTKPTVCLIAQQLRQPDVFEEWLAVFLEDFDTWRLLDSSDSAFGPGSAYVLHVGILKTATSS